MAEIQSSESQSAHNGVDTPLPSTGAVTAPAAPQSKNAPLHKLYALPAPIRTFPLPSFYPNNPVSLFHIVYTWLSQALFPPPNEPSVVYQGLWSPESNSVHIKDQKSMRGLWEQGFYGKGTLSRSEPNWLKREKVRRGLVDGRVIEQVTLERREERKQAKWERARAELDAIRQVQLDEARLASSSSSTSNQARRGSFLREFAAPVGPSELLALPNSHISLLSATPDATSPNPPVLGNFDSGVEPPEVQEKQAGARGHPTQSSVNGSLNGKPAQNGAGLNGIVKSARSSTTSSESSDEPMPLKRRKSVRFSPKVESTTYQLSDPPSPNHSTLNGKSVEEPFTDSLVNNTSETPAAGLGVNLAVDSDISTEQLPLPEAEIVNKEHLQLTSEEAFFLAFGLGALSVVDPVTKLVLPTEALFDLFRQHSYFPTRDRAELQPYDNFLLNYAVYHHFRSLGWVPRGGIKFGVDWLLYIRGPVFDHAEFGVIVVPSYSHPWWKESGRPRPQKSWHWLHGINRVLSHVMKSLVLVYVEVPPPTMFDEALERGPVEVFKLYRIQEVMVRRWSSNRNR